MRNNQCGIQSVETFVVADCCDPLQGVSHSSREINAEVLKNIYQVWRISMALSDVLWRRHI